VDIVTYHSRPKRAPRKKRKQPAIVSRIVTPAPLKPLRGPVIRLQAQVPKRTEFPPAEPQPRRSEIMEPKQKPRTSIFSPTPDVTEEELQRRGDAADALFREIVRRATGDGP
jgi:hypothetical protein